MKQRKPLTLVEMRQAALQAVRDFLRSHMLDPMKFTSEEAYTVLLTVVEEQPHSLAAHWFFSTGFSEKKAFYSGWEDWRQEVTQCNHRPT